METTKGKYLDARTPIRDCATVARRNWKQGAVLDTSIHRFVCQVVDNAKQIFVESKAVLHHNSTAWKLNS
jgi:hypothetical protein